MQPSNLSSGDRWKPTADEINDFRRAADYVRNLERGGGALASKGESTPVRVKNNSGSDQPRCAVLGIDGPIFTPTDNLDLHSAEALEDALAAFEGTVLAVTHDRWFARSCDRFLVFGSDGRVVASDEPVWDEARVTRQR